PMGVVYKTTSAPEGFRGAGRYCLYRLFCFFLSGFFGGGFLSRFFFCFFSGRLLFLFGCFFRCSFLSRFFSRFFRSGWLFGFFLRCFLRRFFFCSFFCCVFRLWVVHVEIQQVIFSQDGKPFQHFFHVAHIHTVIIHIGKHPLKILLDLTIACIFCIRHFCTAFFHLLQYFVQAHIVSGGIYFTTWQGRYIVQACRDEFGGLVCKVFYNSAVAFGGYKLKQTTHSCC